MKISAGEKEIFLILSHDMGYSPVICQYFNPVSDLIGQNLIVHDRFGYQKGQENEEEKPYQKKDKAE
jgi:hypothetical protein